MTACSYTRPGQLLYSVSRTYSPAYMYRITSEANFSGSSALPQMNDHAHAPVYNPEWYGANRSDAKVTSSPSTVSPHPDLLGLDSSHSLFGWESFSLPAIHAPLQV